MDDGDCVPAAPGRGIWLPQEVADIQWTRPDLGVLQEILTDLRQLD